MKKPVVIIFGDSGGIGSATRKIFLDNGYRVVPVNSNIINFNNSTADNEIRSLLATANADVIVNCAGVFVNGWEQDHVNTMNVNFGSNWSILRHFMNPENQKMPTRIILIGSSSHTVGKQLYPLYSASKAALHNLWQGVADALVDTDIIVDIVHPVRTLTKMTTAGKEFDYTLDYLDPTQVAEQIFLLAKQNLPSQCVEMTFERKK